MKLLKNLKTIVRTIKVGPTSVKVGLTAGLLTLFVSGAAVFAGWSPDRPVYNWSGGERTGSVNGPRMNAWIGTPYYGDERAFFDARRTDQSGAFSDVLANPGDGSREVILRTYVHNGANQSTNATNGKATGAKVRIDLPTGTATALRARSYITINNPAEGYPAEVTDTAEMVDDTPFKITYKPGSARLFNDVHNGIQLSDSIVTTGAAIGHNAMDGVFPGCFEYQAFVEIIVKIEIAKPELNKQVRKSGDTTYSDFATVKPGDKIQWLLGFKNAGQVNLDNVAIRDSLPPHVSVVPNSVRYIYTSTDGSTQDVVQRDNSIFGTNQINTGTWKPSGGFYIRFDTLALDDFAGCAVTLRNLGHVRSTQTPTDLNDFADVKIVKDNCVPPPVSFNCDALNVLKVNRTTFEFTGIGSSVNATPTGWIFAVNGVTKQDSSDSRFTFIETTPGEYTVTARYKTTAGTTSVTPVCTQKVIVEQAPATPIFSCDLLKAELIDGRKYRLTTSVTAEGGATVRRLFYNFGDGTAELTTDKTTLEHTYPEQGEFATTVRVEFAANNTTLVVTSAKCRVIVTTKKTPPTALPNTGPGDVVGIFAATTAIAAFAHRFALGRKYNG